MSERYRNIPVACDLAIVSIEQAVHMGLPASYVYELHVAPNLATCARGLVQHMSHHSPLTPVVNVHIDESLRPHEWFIESNGVAIGSYVG